MHRRRRITLLMLLAVTALVCFVLRTESFQNLTSSSTVVEEEVLLNDEVMPEPPKEVEPVKTEIVTPVMSSTSEPVTEPVVGISTSSDSGVCYIGGCSSQICSDQVDIVSTCEWREEYACYQKSICERQATGECGWRKTPELDMCLLNANSQTELEVQ